MDEGPRAYSPSCASLGWYASAPLSGAADSRSSLREVLRDSPRRVDAQFLEQESHRRDALEG